MSRVFQLTIVYYDYFDDNTKKEFIWKSTDRKVCEQARDNWLEETLFDVESITIKEITI